MSQKNLVLLETYKKTKSKMRFAKNANVSTEVIFSTSYLQRG
jgi:hypothetical protein